MTTLRPFQKIRQQVTFCLIAVLSSTQVRSSGAEVFLNGRGDGLNNSASYMAWAVPGSGDTVIVGANNPTGYTLNALPTGSSLSLNGFRVVAGATGTTTFQAFNTAGTTTQTLNIGSGGIDMSLATQNLTLNQTNGNGTLALNLTAAQNWLVGAGRTLTVNSNISGSGGLNLTTTGTGAIATLAGVISTTGPITLNNNSTGALAISGGTPITTVPTWVVNSNNTGGTTITPAITAATSVTANSLNNGAMTFSGLVNAPTISLTNQGTATMALNGGQTVSTALNVTNNSTGTVTLAGALTGSATAINITNGLLGAGTVNLNGTIAGATTTLTVVNNNTTAFSGTLNIAGATNTFAGATTLTGGTTNLRFDTNNNNKLSSTAALTLNRALLNISGNTAVGSQTVLSLALGAGFSRITRSGTGVATLFNANNITRSTGGVLDIGTASIVTTDRLNTNGMLGGWATLNGSDWAINSTSAADGAITAFTAYTTNLAANTWTTPTQNVRANAAVTGTAGAGTINSLKLDTAAQTINQTVTTTLTIGSGGILTVGNFTRVIGTAGAFLTAGTTTDAVAYRAGATNSELFFHINQVAANTVTVNSTIVDNPLLSATSTVVGLNKTQGGTLVLTANNTYTGQTTIGGGTIQVGANGATGSLGTGAIFNNGTLEYQRTDAVTVANNITGIGAVKQNNATGTLTLSGVNTYYGATTATLGLIKAGSANGLSPNSQFVMANVASAKLQLNGFDSTIAGLSGGGTTGGNVELGANTLTVGGGNATQTYSGVISGTGSLKKNGTGTLTLPATTTFTGAVELNAGGLVLPSGTAHTSVTANSGALTMAGNNILSAGLTAANDSVVTMAGNNSVGGSFTVGNTAAVTMAGNNTVTGTTSLSNTSVTTMNGTNTFTGAVTVNGNATFTATGSNTFSNGLTTSAGSVVTLTGNNSYGGPVVLNNTAPMTWAGNNSLTTLAVNAGRLTLTGNNTGMTALTIGAATVVSNRATGAIPDAAAVTMSAAGGGLSLLDNETFGVLTTVHDTQVRIAAGKTLDFDGSASTTLNAAITGAGSLNKNGAGVLTLAGGNSFEGVFNINGGSVVLAPSASAPGVTSIIGDKTAVNLASGTSLNLGLTNSRNETMGSINGQGSVAMGSNGTLFVGANNASTDLLGAITSTTGGTLVKQGTGTMILRGQNTFGTALRIEGGGVTLSNATNALADTATVTLARSNTILTVNNSETVANFNGVRDSELAIASGATVTVNYTDGATQSRIGSSANGSRILFGFNKVNIGDIAAGTQIVSPTNGVPDGSWVVQAFGGGGAGSNGVLLNNQTTNPGVTDSVQFRQVGVLASNITGAGNFTKNGSGSLIFAGSNTNIGNTTINEGAVLLGGIEAGGQYVLSNVLSDQSTLVFGSTLDQSLSMADNATNLQSFERIGGLAGGTSSVLGSTINLVASTNVGTLVLGANNQSTAFAGKILASDAGLGAMLIKEGTGKFTFTQKSLASFDGIVRVDNGELFLPDVLFSNGFGSNTTVFVSNNAGAVFSTDLNDDVRALVGGAGATYQFRDGTIGALTGNFIGPLGAALKGGEFHINGTEISGLTHNLIITGSGLGVMEYAGSSSGVGGISKTGNSTFRMSGSNTFTGTMDISGGNVELGYQSRSAGVGSVDSLATADRRGSLADSIQIELSGGNLALNNLNETIGKIYSSSNALQVSLGRGELTISNQTVDNPLDVNPAFKFAGRMVNGGGISNTGAGYSNIGAVTVSGGMLVLNGTRTLDGPRLNVTGTGVVALEGGSAVNQGVLADSTRVNVGSGGTLTFNSSDTSDGENVGSIQGAGTIALGANRVLTVSEAGGLSDGVFSGVISGSGTSGLAVDGLGALTLSGSNTYTGGTAVRNGAQLILATGAGSGISTVIDSSSTLTLGGGTLWLLGDKAQTFNGLNLEAGTNRIGRGSFATSLVNVGDITQTAGSALFVFASTVQTTSTNTLSGILGGWAVHGGDTFARVGGGGLIEGLPDASYSTTFGASLHTSLPNTVAATSVAASGLTIESLRINNTVGGVDGHTVTFTGSGTVNLNSGGLLVTRGANSTLTTLTAGGGTAKLTSSSGQITLNQQNVLGDLLINMGIIDQGLNHVSLVKTGRGRVILANESSFQGEMVIGAGTLQVGNGGSTGSLGGGNNDIINNGILEFRQTTDRVLNQGIRGSGALVLSGTSTIALNLAATYTGKTNVRSGILEANDANALGSTLMGTSVEAGAGLLISSNSAEPVLLKGGYLQGAGVNLGNIVLAANNSALITTLAGDLAINGLITSPLLSTLRINGDGDATEGTQRIVLNNRTSYGDTHIYKGTLTLNTDLATGRSGNLGTGSVDGNGALEFDLGDLHRVIPNNITGNTDLFVLRNTVYLTGQNSYTGETHVGTEAQQATLRLGNDTFTGSAGSELITNTAPLVVTASTAGNSQLRTHRLDWMTMPQDITLIPNGDGGGGARNADFVKESLGNVILTGSLTAGEPDAGNPLPGTQRALITVNSGRLIVSDAALNNNLNNRLAINNNTHIEFGGTSDYALFGALGGGGSWTLSTTGKTTLDTLSINATNATEILSGWNGNVFVNRGTLKAVSSHQFGDDLDIYVTAGATLQLAGASTHYVDRLGGLGIQVGGTLNLGDNNGGFDLIIDDNQGSYISGKVHGEGDLIWDAPNIMTLIGEKGLGRMSDFTGHLVARQGTVRVDSVSDNGVASAIGAGPAIDFGPIEVNGSGNGQSLGFLDFIGGLAGEVKSSNRSLILHGTNGDTSGGTVSLASVGSGGGILANGRAGIHWTGSVEGPDNTASLIALGARTFILGGESRADNEFSGSISDSDTAHNLSLVKTGNSFWRISGDEGNFRGNIEVNGGILEVAKIEALGNGYNLTAPVPPAAVARTFSVGDARLNFNTSTVATTNFAATTSWVVNGAAEIASSGAGPLLISGTVGQGVSGTRNLILTGTNTGANAVAGIISGANLGVIKNQTSTWRISGANTFGGAVTVNAGTLEIAGGSAIPDTNSVNLANAGSNGSAPGGATLRVVNNETIGTLSGAIGSKVEIDSGATLTLVNGSTVFQGAINGLGGGFTQSSNAAGTARITTLSSANSSYTGVTSIIGGAGAANRLDVSKLANGGANSSIGAATTAASNLVIDTGTNNGGLRYVGVANSSTNRLLTIGAGSGAASIWADGQVYGNSTPTLAFTDTGAVGTINSGARTLTLRGANRGDNIFNPSLVDGAGGATSLNKIENSVWVVGGTTSAFTGAVTISAGTLAVASNNALGTAAGGVTISSGFLDMRGATVTGEALTMNTGAGGFGASNGTSIWTGTVANNANTTWAVLGDTTSLKVTGIVSGSGQVSKFGSGTLILSGAGAAANTNTGAFNARGGIVRLDYTPGEVSRLADGAALVLGGIFSSNLSSVQGVSTRGQDALNYPKGSTIVLDGGSANYKEVVSGLTVDTGASAIVRGSGTSILTVGALTRSNQGGTIDFGADSIVETTTANQSTLSILGGYATVGRSGWAANVSNSVKAITNYLPAWAATNNTSVSTASASGSGLTGSLRFEGGVSSALTLSGAATITSGGILFAQTAGVVDATISGSSLTSGNGKDLIVHQFNEFGQLIINSQITGAISLTKSGLGKLVVTGLNNYTGNTIVNEGILQVGQNGGAGELGTGGLVVNGTLAFDAAGTEMTLPNIRGDGNVRLEQTNVRAILMNQDNSQFQGSFEVLGGTLAIGNLTPNLAAVLPNTPNNNNAFGNSRARASIGIGGTLELRAITTPNPVSLTVNTEITLDGGTIFAKDGNSFANGTITITAPESSINVAANSTLQLNNQIYSSIGFRINADTDSNSLTPNLNTGRVILNAAMFDNAMSGSITTSNLPALNTTPTLTGQLLVEAGELWLNTPGSANSNGNTLFRQPAFFLGAAGIGNEVVVASGATFDLRDADLNYGDDANPNRKIIQIIGDGVNGTGALRNTTGTGTLSNIQLAGNATIGVGGIANGARLDLQSYDIDLETGSTTLPGVYDPRASVLSSVGASNGLTKIGTGDLVFRDTDISGISSLTIKEGELRIERNVPPNPSSLGSVGYDTGNIESIVVAYAGPTRGDYTDTSVNALKSPIVGARLEFYRNDKLTHNIPITLDGGLLDTVGNAAYGGTNYLELGSDTIAGSATTLSGGIAVYGSAKRNIFNIEGADPTGAVFQQGNLTNGVQGKMIVSSGITGTGGISKIGFRELRLTDVNTYSGDTIIARSGSLGLPPRSDTVNINGTDYTSQGEAESWGEWGMTLTGNGTLESTANVILQRTGMLTLDNSTRLDATSNTTTVNIDNRINDAASIKMNQGWLRINSSKTGANAEVIASGGASLQSLSGVNLIDLWPAEGSGQNITLTIGKITRAAGSVLRFRDLNATSTFGNSDGGDSVRVALTNSDGLTQIGNTTGSATTDRAIVVGLLGGIAMHSAYEDIRQVSDTWGQERNRQSYTGSHFMTIDNGYLRPLDDSEYATTTNGMLESATLGGKNVNLTDFAHIARSSLSVNSLRFGPLSDSAGDDASGTTINDRTNLTSYTNNWQPTIIIDDSATLSVASGMVSSASYGVGMGFNLTTIIRGGTLAFGANEGIINNQNLWLRMQDGIYASNNFELMTSISGSAGVTKVGPGTVVFDGVNTYTGATTISEGLLFARNGRNSFGANSTGRATDGLSSNNYIRLEGNGDLRMTNGVVLGTTAAPKDLRIGLLSGDQQVLRSENGNNIFNGDIIYDNVDSVGQVLFRPRISVNTNMALVVNGDIFGSNTAVTEDIYYTDSRLLSLNGAGFITINGVIGDKGVGGVAKPVDFAVNAGPSVANTSVNENQLLRLQITANDDLNVSLTQQYNAAGRLVLDRGVLLVGYDPAAPGNNGKGFWTNTAISRIKNGNSNASLADNGFSNQQGFIIGQGLGDANGNTQALFLTRADQIFNMSEWRVNTGAGTGLVWVGGTQESGTVGFGAFKADGSLPAAGDSQFVGNLNLDKTTRFYQQAGGTSIYNQRMTGGTFVKVGRGTVVLKNTSAYPTNPGDRSVSAVLASDTNSVEIGGGTLQLDYDGAAIFNLSTVSRLGNQNFIGRGGVLQVQGNSGALIAGTAIVTQGLASDNNVTRTVQFLNGNTSIIAEARGVNALTVSLGNANTNNGATNLTRNAGATASFAAFNSVVGGTGVARVNFDFNGNGVAPAAALKNKIIPWATMSDSLRSAQDFAEVDATDGNRVRTFGRSTTGYNNTVSTWATGGDISENTLGGLLGGSGFYGTLASTLAIDTLRFDTSANSTVNIANGQALVLANSGLLVSSNVGSANKSITGGSIATTVLKTGNLTSGSPIVTSLASTSDLFAGMPVNGYTNSSGVLTIPVGVYISSIDSPSQITLSSNASVTATAQPIQFGNSELIVHQYGTGNLNLSSNFGRTISTTGDTTLNNVLIDVASTAGIAPGMSIVGSSITPGTTIASVGVGQLTLTNPATANSTGQTFVIGTSAFTALNGSTTSGSTSVGIATTDGLVPGMTITGPNIPANAIIVSITNSISFTINLPATASASSLNFTVGTPLSLTISGPSTTSPSEFGTAGTVVLNSAYNGMTGRTVINGGVLSIADDSQLGIAPGVDVADQLTFNGGTLRWTGQGGLLSQTRGVTLQGGGGVIDVADSLGHLVIQRAIESFEQYRGDLVKTGAGTLTLEGDAGNQGLFRGLLDVRQGTIRLAGDNPDAAAGTTSIFGSNQTWADGTIMRSGTNMLLQMGDANATGEWSIEEFITFEGNNRMTVGTLGNAVRTVNWNAPVAINGTLTVDTLSGQTFRFGNGGGFIQGNGDIVKAGLGTLEFRENSTDWQGGLNIQQGRVLALNQADVLGTGHTVVGKSITLGSNEQAGFAELLISSNDLGTGGSVWEVNMPINVTYNPAQTKRLGVWKQGGNGGQTHQFNGAITLNDNLQLYYEEDNNAFPVGGEFVFADYTGGFKDGTSSSGNLVLKTNVTANGGNDNDATNGRAYVTHTFSGDNHLWTGDLVIGTNTAYGQDNNTIARLNNSLALTAANDVTMNYNSILQVGGSTVTMGSLITAGGTGAFLSNSGTMSSSTGSTNVIENAAAAAGKLTLSQSTPASVEVLWNAMFRDGTPASHWFVPGQSQAGGSLSIVKAGNGWATLTQNNEYTGSTEVTGGILQVGVNGIGTTGAARALRAATPTNLLTPDFKLNAGVTLAGTGTVRGLTLLNGKINPGDVGGDAMGTLTIDGNAVFAAGSVSTFQINRPTLNAPDLLDMQYAESQKTAYDVQRDLLLKGVGAAYAAMLSDPVLSTQHDRINITGQATLTATAKFALVLNGYAPVAGDVFKVLDFASVTGSINVGTEFRLGGEVNTDLALPFLSDSLYWDTSLFNSSGIVFVVADRDPAGAAVAPSMKIITPPVGVIVPLGATSASFSALAIGPGNLSAQWQKKLKTAADIPGATGNAATSYTVTAPGIAGFVATDVAKYAVRYTSDAIPTVNPVTSVDAELGFVDTTSSPRVLLPAKASTTFTVKAYAPTVANLRYQWLKDGLPVADSTLLTPSKYTGTKTATLKITGLTSNEQGVYTCNVSIGGGAPAAGGSHELGLLLTPAFMSQTLPNGKVSALYNDSALGYQVSMDTTVERAAASFTATGLPPGLTIDKITGKIKGNPTTAGTYTGIIITALNAAGKTSSPAFSIRIDGVSEKALGAYVALVDRADSTELTDKYTGGLLTLLTTVKGSYTGKLVLGSLSYAIKGNLNNSGSHPHISQTIIRKAPLLNIQLEADLITTDDGGAGVRANSLHGTIQKLVTSGPAAPTIAFAGWRNVWFVKDVAAKKATKTTAATDFVPKHPAAPYLGSHNFMLTTAPALDNDGTIPHGATIGIAKVALTGISTTAGKLADGTAFTLAAPIGENGEVALFNAIYTIKGSLHGSILIEKGFTENLVPLVPAVTTKPTKAAIPAHYAYTIYKSNAQKVTGPDAASVFTPYPSPTWFKPDQTTGLKPSVDRVYKLGFGGTTGLALTTQGGLYIAPPKTGIVMSLDPSATDGVTTHVTGTVNAQALFADSGTTGSGIAGGVEDSVINPNLDGTDSTHPFFEIKPISTVVAPLAINNAGATKVAFVSTTGAVSGSFTLNDVSAGLDAKGNPVTPTFKRAPKFIGQIIPDASTSDPYDGTAYGFFVMERLPVPPETLSSLTVEKRSGLVVISKK